MKKKFCCCFLLFIFVTCCTHAQSHKSAKDSSVVIIFNEGSSTKSSARKKGSSEKNIIKISPLGFLSGQFPLMYERSINDFLSVQVGVGVTHRNYVRSAITDASESEPKYSSYPWPGATTGSFSDEAEPIYKFDRRKVKLGYMATIQPRIYFGSEGLDGSFVGLSFDYLRYNFESPKAILVQNELMFNGPMQQEHENIKDFMVNFGWQTLYDRISLEYTLGLGLRNVSGSKYAATTATANNSSNRIIFDGNAAYTDTRLNFGIGLKVGCHF